MKWSDLLSFSTVNDVQEASKYWIEGNRYYNEVTKMIASGSVRKMMHKSVLYPADSRTRSQSSYALELTSCSRKICENIFIAGDPLDSDDFPGNETGYFIGDVITMAVLLRSCGRSPYGYPGENAIREWFKENISSFLPEGYGGKKEDLEWMTRDLTYFSGNGLAVRRAVRYMEKGINVTYPLIKIISDSDQIKEYGTFFSEREFIAKAENITGTKGMIHPLSYILSAARGITVLVSSLDDAALADGIMCRQILSLARNSSFCDEKTDTEEYQNLAYTVKILSDGYRKLRSDPFANDDHGVISDWLSSIRTMLGAAAAECFRNNYQKIMKGEFEGTLTENSSMRAVVKMLKTLYDVFVWRSQSMTAVQMRTKVLTDKLMELFVRPAAESRGKSDDEFLSMGQIRLIAPEYKKVYLEISKGRPETERVYLRILMASDYICDLTEDQAEDIIKKFGR